MRFESASNTVTCTGHFYANGNSSARKYRSAAGLLLALVLLPVLVACLPVPVGDPEKSRIDPGLSGIWRVAGVDDGEMLMSLDPYDKRTWLATLIELDAVDRARTGNDAVSEEAAVPQLPFNAANADRFRAASLGVYKCWLTRIGGETFITWESKTLPGTPADQWWVFRVRKSGNDTFYLDSFDYGIDGLDEVGSHKEAEKIIRRHVRDPGFFREENAPRLERVPASELSALPRLLEEFGFKDTM